MVGAHAAGLVLPGMRLGLGSGRMATGFIRQLRPRIASGLQVQGLCTSRATEALAREAGVGLLSSSRGGLDLDVDGADEFDSSLSLLKGGGGALLREKVVAERSRRFWFLADASKRVARLGSEHPVPVEVLRYDWEGTAARCETRLGCRAQLRLREDHPVISDNGNFLLDLDFPGGLADPQAVAAGLSAIAGVLGHGLFLGQATAGLIFDSGGVQLLGDLDFDRGW